jgi:ParB-like chromosome segregation protein Spo0J
MEGQAIVIDGNTRVEAAKQAWLESITVGEREFKDQEHALEYAINNQRNRRNLTDSDLLRCIQAVDKRKKRGGDHKSKEAKSKGATEPIDSSAKVTTGIVGTSESKVKKARTILDHADKDTQKEITDGKKSIHRGYQETQKKKKRG